MQPTILAPTTAPAKRRATRNLPEGAQPLTELLALATTEWATRPRLTLQWMTQAQAAQLATDFAASIRAAGAADDAILPAVLRLA